MALRNRVYKEITDKGEAVTIYNSTQTTDSDTPYESLTADTYVDGNDSGTSETAVIQPIDTSRNQYTEGRLYQGDARGFFRYDSVITNDSLVKIDGNNYLYKVKKIDQLRVSGVLTHYEVMLEFIRDSSE